MTMSHSCLTAAEVTTSICLVVEPARAGIYLPLRARFQMLNSVDKQRTLTKHKSLTKKHSTFEVISYSLIETSYGPRGPMGGSGGGQEGGFG